MHTTPRQPQATHLINVARAELFVLLLATLAAQRRTAGLQQPDTLDYGRRTDK